VSAPSVSLRVIDAAGHLVNVEEPELFVREVRAFLLGDPRGGS
jgi:pimeloyl-ACP methyl ester carboxylesterase